MITCTGWDYLTAAEAVADSAHRNGVVVGGAADDVYKAVQLGAVMSIAASLVELVELVGVAYSNERTEGSES